MHNETWLNGYGNRCIIIDSGAPPAIGGYNLVELNRISFTGVSADSVANTGLDVRTRFNIVRRNVFFNCADSGLQMAGGGSQGDQAIFNHIYHNTFYNNGLVSAGTTAAIGMQTWSEPFIVATNSIFNNIFWMNPAVYWNSGANAALALQILSNNWNQTGNPVFADVATPYTATTVGKPNLSLQPSSPCIDAGAFLTTISSASGSGTSFTVSDPHFFQHGLCGVENDTIQLQGQQSTARIININSTTKTITVDRSLTWTNGQGVALPYSGSAPDIGAFEANMGPEYPAPPTQLRTTSGR
jgi:hypothetical protein